MEVPLNGQTNTPLPRKGRRGNQDDLPYPEITKFLTQHPTAKIVVVIDTHCFQENGLFVWSPGEGEQPSPEGCTLWDVGCLLTSNALTLCSHVDS